MRRESVSGKKSHRSSRLANKKSQDEEQEHPEVLKVKKEFDQMMMEQRAMINFQIPKSPEKKQPE